MDKLELQWWLNFWNFVLSVHSGPQPAWPSRFLRENSHLSRPFTSGCAIWLYSQGREEEISSEMSLVHSNFFHFFLIEMNTLMGILDPTTVCECLWDRWCLPSYTVFQNHVASIELTHVNSNQSLQKSFVKQIKNPFTIVCITCAYSSTRSTTYFQKQL